MILVLKAISLAMAMLKSSTDRSGRKENLNIATGGNVILITDTLSDTEYPNLPHVKEQVNKILVNKIPS